MPRTTRRPKVISIRLSQDEFEQFQSLCAARGIENVSELARAAMKLLIVQERTNGKAAMESRVNEIDVHMSVLDREVDRLSTLMGLARLEEAR